VLLAAGCRDRARDLRVGDLVFWGKVGSEGFFLFFSGYILPVDYFLFKMAKGTCGVFGFSWFSSRQISTFYFLNFFQLSLLSSSM
jgi:hypothetical protein